MRNAVQLFKVWHFGTLQIIAHSNSEPGNLLGIYLLVLSITQASTLESLIYEPTQKVRSEQIQFGRNITSNCYRIRPLFDSSNTGFTSNLRLRNDSLLLARSRCKYSQRR